MKRKFLSKLYNCVMSSSDNLNSKSSIFCLILSGLLDLGITEIPRSIPNLKTIWASDTPCFFAKFCTMGSLKVEISSFQYDAPCPSGENAVTCMPIDCAYLEYK